jgi:UPF0716 protein FxsA
MRFALLLLMIGLPLLELALLIKIGQYIGTWPTIMIVVGTALLGLAILQYQGLTAIRRGMKDFANGEPPVATVMDTVLLIGAGVLLIAPGVTTDFLGLLLLIPPIRTLTAGWLLRQMTGGVFSWSVSTGNGSQNSSAPQAEDMPPRRAKTSGPGPVIEGEFERIDEKTIRPGRGPRPPS